MIIATSPLLTSSESSIKNDFVNIFTIHWVVFEHVHLSQVWRDVRQEVAESAVEAADAQLEEKGTEYG